MNFVLNEPVVLETFLGETNPPHPVRDSDNYWKLIGEQGVVAKTEAQSKMPKHERGERLLIVFDVDVVSLGLSCHNEIPNSLWIFISDLRRIPDKKL
jgi:hypothetical protein